MPDDPLSLRIYRRLLKLYPAGFRQNYAGAMERAFRDELRESAGFGLWARLIVDLAVTIPAQFAREITQDSRHTFRLWAVRPWLTAFAILALAIGIGANTGVFSVVDALLLRSLPFHDSDRLVSFQFFFPPHDSPNHFHKWRGQSSYLADAALWQTVDANLDGAGEWQRARVAQTSWNFFALLGVQPVLGRAFMAGEEAVGNGWGPGGSNAVAVISYGLWQSMFGGDRSALGAIIRIDGNPLTVVGVAPPEFDYPEKAMVWKPAAFAEGNYGFTAIGRLKPGISVHQARTPFLAEADRFQPGRRRSPNFKPPVIAPLRDELAGSRKNASLVLMGGVVLILLIACTNVANLLMARTADRAPELSVRSALGASRARIMQQLLTECGLLSLAAAAAGVLVAYGVTALAGRLQPAVLAAQTYSPMNARVLTFAVAIALFAGLLFGLLPAIHAGRIHTFGMRGSSDTRGSRRLREALVAAQVMLTIMLAGASISVGRAFLHLMQADRGFDRSGVVTAMVSLSGTTHETDASRLAYFQEAIARLRRLPGVRAASTTQFLPLDAKGFTGGRFSLDGRQSQLGSAVVPVMQDYFLAMGDRVIAGREFTEADMHSTEQIAIVNDVFAREFGQPSDLIGRQVTIGRVSWRIVGVVRAMDYMAEDANTSQIFRPSRSPGWPRTAIVVKVAGRAEDHLAMVRATIQSVDPRVPLFSVETMQQRMDDEFARPRFYRTAVMSFAAFALLLAIIGIYGIVSYAVARRSHEMGVRMALGATPATLRASLLGEGLIPIVSGAIPGIAGAVLSGKLLENLVAGAKSVDAAAYAAAILFIALIAAAGIWAATRPITRLDVMEILQAE